MAVTDQWFQYDFGAGNEKEIVEYDVIGSIRGSVVADDRGGHGGFIHYAKPWAWL